MTERLLALAQAWAELGFLGLCALALVFTLGTLSFMPRFTFYSVGGVVFGLLPERVRVHRLAGPAYGLVIWLGYELAIAPVLGTGPARHRTLEELTSSSLQGLPQ